MHKILHDSHALFHAMLVVVQSLDITIFIAFSLIPLPIGMTSSLIFFIQATWDLCTAVPVSAIYKLGPLIRGWPLMKTPFHREERTLESLSIGTVAASSFFPTPLLP